MTKSRSRVHTRRGHPLPSTGAAAEVDPKGRHLPQLTQVQERIQTQTPQTGINGKHFDTNKLFNCCFFTDKERKADRDSYMDHLPSI